MGLFDSLKSGAKDAFKQYDKVKVKKKITYDELFEIMQKGTYSIGTPELSGKGIMRCIRFPAVNKYMVQVAITSKTITISRVYANVGGIAKEMAGNAITRGLYDVANRENIDLNRATREVGDTLTQLLTEAGYI